jgi:hypothetical protein
VIAVVEREVDARDEHARFGLAGGDGGAGVAAAEEGRVAADGEAARRLFPGVAVLTAGT